MAYNNIFLEGVMIYYISPGILGNIFCVVSLNCLGLRDLSDDIILGALVLFGYSLG